ncbi:ATP-binding protein [Acidaminococcus fermentans]|uniref:sensor histidine kinase n=1 Tax=Acidaminococcus fermentans TaxID=905 RepID=UPI00242CC655|nr:ATP-binding protein [Acidaminococcus fermentans]
MKKSLSTRLMYSYMGLILAIIVGISIGLSYLITDYFFRTKELELNDKGGQVAMMIRYFDAMSMDKAILREYLTSMDQLVGARIWVFNKQFDLIAASETGTEYEQGREGNDSKQEREARRREKWMQSVAAIDRQIRQSGNGHERFQKILTKVYGGERVNERIYHPYYKEQVLMVGIPLKDNHGMVSGAMLLASPLGGLNRVLKDIYIYTIIVGIIALCISVIIVSGLTRRMVKPLISMKNSAKAIALGDYSLKVAVDGDDEIADLGRSLNSLGRDLEQFVRKTRKMEKMRRDFVANVSHELRTPITIIQGYNEALSDGTITDPEDVKKYRKLINDETQRLERLINELLDISRLQRGEGEEMEPIPLGKVVESVVNMLEGRAQKRDIRLEQYVDDSLLVLGNGDRLYQLVMILGDNAIKYSPDSSVIRFQVMKNRQGGVILTVVDQGYGIPEEDIPYIWERFYKADKSHSRHIPGTGLGLAIGKEIIRMHKAKVQVKSKVGKGTAFVITFPPFQEKPKVTQDGAHEAEVVENIQPLAEDDTVAQEEEERNG